MARSVGVNLGSRTASPDAAAERLCAELVPRMLDALRNGHAVPDADFDTLYPAGLRRLSEIHWTPVDVALRAARLLVTGSHTRVLDVGAAVGKFCLVGALATPGSFCGVERRAGLSRIALEVAETLRVPRVRYLGADMADVDWGRFDAFYLFNPFYENVMPVVCPGGRSVPNAELFDGYVGIVEDKLRASRPGTRVVTYHGFGGRFPHGFVRVPTEEPRGSELQLWMKSDRY